MKVHLADSGMPLVERTEQTALCGAKIPDAQFAFIWDDMEVGERLNDSLNSLSICRKCVLRIREIEAEGQKLNSYIYGLQHPEKQTMRGAA